MVPVWLLITLTLHNAEAPVQLERRTAPVREVVRELATKAHLDLSTDESVANEVLFVNLGATPVRTMAALVAQADSAEWVRQGTRWTLTRSPALLAWWKATDEEALTKLVTKQISASFGRSAGPIWSKAELHRLLTSAPPKRSAFASGPDPDAQPARLVARTVSGFSPRTLATLEVGQTLRFSTDPTTQQEPLQDPNVRQFLREYSAVDAEYERLSPLEKLVARTNRLDFFEPEYDNSGNDFPVLATLTRRGLFDFDGQVSIPSQTRPEDEPYHYTFSFDLRGRHELQLPNDRAWSEERVAGGYWPDVYAREGIADPEEAKVFSDPAAHEPLVLILGPPLLRLSNLLQKDVIARIPDEIIGELEQTGWSDITLETVVEALNQCDHFSLSEGVYLGRSRFPSESNTLKLNRQVASKLFAASEVGKRIPDNLLNDYVLRQGDGPAGSGLEKVLFRACSLQHVPGFRIDDLVDGDRDAFQIWADLSPAQRAEMLAGGSVPVSALGVAGENAVRILLFHRRLLLSDNRDPSSCFEEVPADAFLSVKGGRAGLHQGFYSGPIASFYLRGRNWAIELQ